MHVIIGSHAIKQLGIELREPADLDYWYYGERPLFYYDGRTEGLEMPKEIVDYVDSHNCLDTFYTIKLSHAAWDVKWEKTVSDMMYFKRLGAKCDDKLYNMLYPFWLKFHGDKEFLSLKKTKEQFFYNNVLCPIDHDYLHEVVAHYEKPLYTTVLKEGEDVLIDRDKFLALSEEDRLKMIREEVYVIALERWYIPLEGRIPAVVAYMRALKLVATRLCKGWFSKYLLDNYDKLCYIDRTHHFVKIFNNREKAHDRASINPRVSKLLQRAV